MKFFHSFLPCICQPPSVLAGFGQPGARIISFAQGGQVTSVPHVKARQQRNLLKESKRYKD